MFAELLAMLPPRRGGGGGLGVCERAHISSMLTSALASMAELTRASWQTKVSFTQNQGPADRPRTRWPDPCLKSRGKIWFNEYSSHSDRLRDTVLAMISPPRRRLQELVQDDNKILLTIAVLFRLQLLSICLTLRRVLSHMSWIALEMVTLHVERDQPTYTGLRATWYRNFLYVMCYKQKLWCGRWHDCKPGLGLPSHIIYRCTLTYPCSTQERGWV